MFFILVFGSNAFPCGNHVKVGVLSFGLVSRMGRKREEDEETGQVGPFKAYGVLFTYSCMCTCSHQSRLEKTLKNLL